MKPIILLMILFCSCKSGFVPAPPQKIEGIYFGQDSPLHVQDVYTSKMFGDCIEIVHKNNKFYIYDIELEPVGDQMFRFDYVEKTDYGIGLDTDYHMIRRMGTCSFNKIHLTIEYSVGDIATGLSTYRFEGRK